MSAYFKNMADKLFWEGIEKGDILWFIHRNIKNATKNCSYFIISLFTIIFCSIEIACQLYMLTQKPTVGQMLTFGPMFFTSIHVLFSVGPLLVQRYSYVQVYQEYRNLWSLKTADKQGLLEIRQLFQKGLYTVMFYVLIAVLCGVCYLPLNGLNFERSIWPAIAALKLIEDGPKTVIYSVVFTNFALVFAKAYFMAIYGMHLMHLCILYNTQNILLRRRLCNITYDNVNMSPMLLVDNKKYQNWVQKELKECVKLDIKLKGFSDSCIRYFQVVLLFQIGNAILILSMLYYINLFLNGGFSPMGSRLFVVAANLMACIYAHYSETFYEQTDHIRNALFETPWHTFNISNRKLVLVYLSNLTKPKFISAGGMFDVNYSLLILVMHKVFNILTVLSKMNPEGDPEKKS